jgi:hypothetical protein
MRDPNTTSLLLINTPLQRGEALRRQAKNRFNGLPQDNETVQTVSTRSFAVDTPLKQGVNESAFRGGLKFQKKVRCETEAKT